MSKNPKEHAPPANPASWEIWGLNDEYIMTVSDCKTAYDAWKASGLSGGFNAYRYECLSPH